MLEVLPLQTKDEQKKACELCGAEYLPDALAYAAYVDGVTAGVCQFSLSVDGGVIRTLNATQTGEANVLFVMGRTAMSFMEMCGAEAAYFAADNVPPALVSAIGFKPDETGKPFADLRGFFDHPCSHT